MNLTNIKVFSPPRTNLKRQQLARQRKQTINFENLNLLKKLEHIDQRKPSANQPYQKPSLNFQSRVRNSKRIFSENHKIAQRLQSQVSKYSQHLLQQVPKERYDKRYSISSMSMSKGKMSSSFENNPASNYSLKRWRTEADEGAGCSSSWHNTKFLSGLLSVQIKGRRYYVEFKGTQLMSLIEVSAKSKRYQVKLPEKVGRHLQELIKERRIELSSRIGMVDGVLSIKIPFEGFSRVYKFSEGRRDYPSTRMGIKSRTRNTTLTKHTNKLEFSDDVSSPDPTKQNTKDITYHQPCERGEFDIHSEEIITESDHSYMFNDSEDEQSPDVTPDLF